MNKPSDPQNPPEDATPVFGPIQSHEVVDKNEFKITRIEQSTDSSSVVKEDHMTEEFKLIETENKFKKILDNLKNGSPATKFLALFLVAPKGFFIFSLPLLKKFLVKNGIEVNAAAVGVFAAKVAFGIAVWAAMKKFIRENPKLKKELRKIVDFG